MATRTWFGGNGDWYNAAAWTSGGAPGVPAPGDFLYVNSGVVEVSRGEEFASGGGPLDAVTLDLASTLPGDPSVIVATDGDFGRNVEILSGNAGAAAGFYTVGPTGFAGTIEASASGGVFAISPLGSDGTQAAMFVLLDGGLIDVSGRDTFDLNGVMVSESGVTIEAGAEFINNGTDILYGGTTKIEAGATLTGAGLFYAESNATLEIDVPATQTILFELGGRVNLGAVASFAGRLSNFVQGDTIDLLNTAANAATWNVYTGLLTIENNNQVVAQIHLDGPSNNIAFNTMPDGAGGTVIDYPGSALRYSYEIDTADQALGANLVRLPAASADGTPINGAGVTIGIISDSFNIALDGTSDPADLAARLGFLPTTAAGTSAVIDLSDALYGGSDEGLAMAEAIHQIAPGATIEFYAGGGNSQTFAQAVTALTQSGANIIVDDLSVYDMPYYQAAGPVDAALENAVASGVNVFVSAGNMGQAYYESNWQPEAAQLVLARGVPPQAVSAQQFSNGTALQDITVPASTATTIRLEWDAAWPSQYGFSSDPLAMVLYDSSGNVVATSYQTFSSASGAYVPEIQLTVPVASTATHYQLAIYQVGTASVSQFKYVLDGTSAASGANASGAGDVTTSGGVEPGGVIDDPKAGQGSGDVNPQALVAGVNAVGAAYMANSPAFGVAPDWLEGFSSVGTGALLFDGNGNRLPSPVTAGGISFVAPDGMPVYVPGFGAFFGTSAAAPNAAAVAALMLQADPNLTTAQVTSLLQRSAATMDLPASDQGAGLVQAVGAVQWAQIEAEYQPPAISGTVADQTTLDDASVMPFSHVTLDDTSANDTVTLTVTLSSAANGVLSNLGGGNYDSADGTYTFTGSPAAAQAALNGLVFAPTEHEVLPGETIATTFTIRVDGSDTGGHDSTTSVVATGTPLPNDLQQVFYGSPGGNPVTTTDDILFQNTQTGLVLDWEMSNGTIAAGVPIAGATPDWQLVGTGDLYGDGTDDILFQNANTGLVLDWQIENGSLVAGHAIGNLSPGWEVVGTGDFAGDGTDDILLQNAQSGQMADWQMQNGTLASANLLATANFDWKFVGVGAFYNYGTDDILFQNISSGAVLDWQMAGGAVVGGQILGSVTPGWTAIGTGYIGGAGEGIVFENTAAQSLVGWDVYQGVVVFSAPAFNGSNFGSSLLPPGMSVVGIGEYGANGTAVLLQQAGSGQITMLRSAFGANTEAPVGVATPDWRVV